MLTCNDYYILATSLVFSCHGLKLHSHISISFISHAYSARKSSLRSWIKRFPCKASQGGSARFQQQFPSKLPSPCPSGLLSRNSFLLFKFFFPSLMKELSLSTKEGSCLILSRTKATPSSIFQESPFSSTSLSQQIPLRKESSALPSACLEGLCGFEVPLRLFISMTSDHCESLWSRKRTLLHLTIYKTDWKESSTQMRIQSKYNREKRRRLRTVGKQHTLTILLSVGNTSACFCSCSASWKVCREKFANWVTEK